MKYWVLDGREYKADIKIDTQGNAILSNGIVSRTVNTWQCTTTSLQNLSTGVEYINQPYCDVCLVINGVKMTLNEEFKFVTNHFVNCTPKINFLPTDTMTNLRQYPPKGTGLETLYTNEQLGINVRVVYELYDEIPTIMKQVFVDNVGTSNVVVDDIKVDVMNIVEYKDRLCIDSNYNASQDISKQIYEATGKHYCRYIYDFLEVGTLNKMMQTIEPSGTVESIIAYETVLTAEYHEQKLIELKKVYRYIAPWTSDSVLFFHLIANSSKAIRKAIDQCAEVGVEMIIQSFGSGVNMESTNAKYLDRIKEDYDYAHSKNIRIGAYTLAYVKDYSPVRGHEALNHDSTNICRCLATEWSKQYILDIINFVDCTGADAIEIDGPCGLFLCAGGKTHLHEGFEDSQYAQWKISVHDWYRELKKRNVYINAPDWHFLNGINRCPIGYEENSFSETRQEQLAVNRIYFYKGTFGKTPAMGWGFLPLNQYHGGGKQATFFPISKNAFDYDWALAQVVASGVWPTLRGVKIYDSILGKEILSKWIGIFKQYRQVLNGITVHFMPPRLDKENLTRTLGIDAIMNQLPYGEDRGFVMFFNQTDAPITQRVLVPVFYTGLTNLDMPSAPFPNTNSCDIEYPLYGDPSQVHLVYAREKASNKIVKDPLIIDKEIPPLPQATPTDRYITVSYNDIEPVDYNIDSNGNIELEITLPAMSYQWYVMRAVNKDNLDN